MALKAAKAANASISLEARRALIVGGTSGIGEGIALTLAKMKADVTIVGRSKEAGDKIVAQMQKANPSGAYDFQPLDLSLMGEVRKFAKKYTEEHKSLNYLVVSAGIMTMKGRTETPEGIDIKLAIHYYGRWLLINQLLPLMESTVDSGGEARVLSVLAAAKGGPVPFDDLDLKKNYGLKAAADAAPFHNDLMVEEFSIRHSKVAFMHAFPGFVNTPLPVRKEMPWYLRWPAQLLLPLGTSITDCGEYLTHGMLDQTHAKGWHLLDQHGNSVKPLKAHTAEARTKVWEHTEKLVAAALEKSASGTASGGATDAK